MAKETLAQPIAIREKTSKRHSYLRVMDLDMEQ